MRRRLLPVLLLAIVAAVVFIEPVSLVMSEDEEAEPVVVGLENDSVGFYPYLNDADEFDDRSAINLIVKGDADSLIEALTTTGAEEVEREPRQWVDLALLDAPEPVETDRENATERDWSTADGAVRYAYIGSSVSDGEWVTETAQLEDGDYYGHRHHLRLYEGPTGEWVLVQAHVEHFDWFTLRHQVSSIEEAQAHLEQDLTTLEGVDGDDIERVYLDNTDSSDSDGWATLVDMTAAVAAPVALAMALSSARGRLGEVSEQLVPQDRTHVLDVIALAGSVILLVGFVRLLGLALEWWTTALTPHMIAAIGYPILALGLPIAVGGLARRLPRRTDAALITSGAFATAIWFEYVLLGVSGLSLDIVLHRAILTVGLGLLAAGVAAEEVDRELLVAGVGLWLFGLVVGLAALV